MSSDSFNPLIITPAALSKIREVMDLKKVPAGMGLRVGVKGGGCGVGDYLLGFDQKQEGDDEYEVSGLRVLIDKRHSLHVLGMEIDWFEDESQKGFVFLNPMAKKNESEDAKAKG